MALRKREEKQTLRVFGVNLADNEDEMELGWFVALTNWVPGDLYSLRKKRGVESVPSGLTEFTLSNPC